MSSRGGGRQGRGNRGGRDNNRGGRGRGRSARGNNYSTANTTRHRGLCAALGNHVFDYGQKGAADQMRTTWEKIVHHVGTIYGHDISNELQNMKIVVIKEPTYTDEVLAKHAEKEARRITQETRVTRARTTKRTSLLITSLTDPDDAMKLAILDNEIEEATYLAGLPLPVKLDEEESNHNHNEWRTYRERTSRLAKQRGQAFSMIRGQCMQILLDKMKHDPQWLTASESYDPLTLFRIIEKTILAQTEDQYPYATVYEQECSLYSFQQNILTNEQWYERFNTRIDVGTAIGVTRQHKVLLDHVGSEFKDAAGNPAPREFDNMTDDQQKTAREEAEERYISYVFLRQSGKQHNKLKVDLQNDFTTGDDRYPKNRQATLHLLDKYSKSIIVSSTTPSEGTSFAQKGGGKGNKNNSTYDKDYWKDKECFNCHKIGHPANHCPENPDKQEDDAKSVSSKTSKASHSSRSSKGSINKLQRKLKKSFATLTTTQTALATKIDEMNEESSISSSEDEVKSSHFQMGWTLTQTGGIILKQDFERRNADILFKKSGSKLNLDLRNIILLDNESTMDLFCNTKLVNDIRPSQKVISLQSNGGNMKIKMEASITGYHKQVWFSKHAITNIIALSNLIQQYRVTYDSDDQTFVVHRQKENKPDMYFKMHESGLHYHDPSDAEFSFNVNTVSNNIEDFTKKQVEGATRARTLYATLGYPSIKDFKWVIQSNQIQNCPVTVQDIVTAHQIWGKNISALKGKTTHKKP